MQRYKKKPVECDAVQLTEEMLDKVPHPEHVPGVLYDPVNRIARIKTHMGTMIACVGDWIVKDDKGLIYPVRAKAFEAMFEPATPPEAVTLRLVEETKETKGVTGAGGVP